MSRAPAGKMHAHPDQLPAAHLRIARHGAAAEQGPATSRPAERVLPVTAKIRIMRVQGHALLNPRTRLLMLRRFLHALRIRRSTRSSGLGGACQVPRGRARKMWMPSAAGCRSLPVRPGGTTGNLWPAQLRTWEYAIAASYCCGRACARDACSHADSKIRSFQKSLFLTS